MNYIKDTYKGYIYNCYIHIRCTQFKKNRP